MAADVTTIGADTAPPGLAASQRLVSLVQTSLEDDKADDIVVIDLAGKSDIADYMVIATGRSQRQVGAMAEHLVERMKPSVPATPAVEGAQRCDWVLIDGGDVIVHLFRPEVRAFYNLEKMWGSTLPAPQRPAVGG